MIESGPAESVSRLASESRWRPVISYLSPRGRISRRTFLLQVVAPCGLAMVGLLTIGERRSPVGMLLLGLVYWVYLVGLAKRLQDFGLRGRPIAGVLVIALWMQREGPLELPEMVETYVYALFGVALLFAASTGSEPGDNAYGPPPAPREWQDRPIPTGGRGGTTQTPPDRARPVGDP